MAVLARICLIPFWRHINFWLPWYPVAMSSTMYVCAAWKQFLFYVCFKPNHLIGYAFVSKIATNSESWFQLFLPFTMSDIRTSFIDLSSFLRSNPHLFNISLSERKWIIISKRHPRTPWADPQNIWFGDQLLGSKHSLSVVRQVVVLCITL